MSTTAIDLFLIVCFGFACFNLGQAWAITRSIREDNERHTEEMRRLRKDR